MRSAAATSTGELRTMPTPAGGRVAGAPLGERAVRDIGRCAAITGVLALVALGGVAIAGPATAAVGPTCTGSATVTCTFWSLGIEQAFTVPTGVSSLHVVLVGASGGNGGASGGRGGILAADIPVSASSQLFVEVGGNGASNTSYDVSALGGFNGGGAAAEYGGGSGGGASDIRTVSRSVTGSLDSRLVVAGAGGGGGARLATPVAGGGGDAGFLVGGVGGDGAPSPDVDGGTGGGGGTESAGGAGGLGADSNGAAGAKGTGGDGSPCCESGGGGGGGGSFGGGGGGAGYDSGAGGGGGGSSFAASRVTGDSFTLDGTRSPRVVITYTPDTSAPVCSSSVGAGVPKVVTFHVTDADGGLASVDVVRSDNADTVVPTFTSGAGAVDVTATKANQAQPMDVQVTATDVAGNVSDVCRYADAYDQYEASTFSVRLPSGVVCQLEAKLERTGPGAAATTGLLSTDPACADPKLRAVLTYVDVNGQTQQKTVVEQTNGQVVASATDSVRIIKTTHGVSFPSCGNCGTTVTQQPK